jgi:hypothetical protein
MDGPERSDDVVVGMKSPNKAGRPAAAAAAVEPRTSTKGNTRL